MQDRVRLCLRCFDFHSKLRLACREQWGSDVMKATGVTLLGEDVCACCEQHLRLFSS